MSKLDSTEYHAMEDQQDAFETYVRWVQLIRAAGGVLICVSLWPYLHDLDDVISPWEFVGCVVFALIVEVLAGVYQVRLDHKKVTIVWYALSLVIGLFGGLLYLLPDLAVLWLSTELTKVQWAILGRVLVGFYCGRG